MKTHGVAWNEAKDTSYQINYDEKTKQTDVIITVYPISTGNGRKAYGSIGFAPKDVAGHTVLITSWDDATLVTLGHWQLVDALKWVEDKTGYKHLECEFWKDQSPHSDKGFKWFTVTWNKPEESDSCEKETSICVV